MQCEAKLTGRDKHFEYALAISKPYNWILNNKCCFKILNLYRRQCQCKWEARLMWGDKNIEYSSSNIIIGIWKIISPSKTCWRQKVAFGWRKMIGKCNLNQNWGIETNFSSIHRSSSTHNCSWDFNDKCANGHLNWCGSPWRYISRALTYWNTDFNVSTTQLKCI